MATKKKGIFINLLPPEFLSEEIKMAKFYKIQTIGVIVILVMIFLSSLTVSLRILQSHNIAQIQTKLSSIESRIEGSKDKQASLFVLKNRLATINKYLGQPSKQNQMYELLNKLLPSSITLSSLSIDRNGDLLITAISSDSVGLDNFITSLSTSETNEEKIDKVSVDSFNRGRDGIYRVGLKISSKQ